MDNDYYNKLILDRVDKNFNRVLPVGAFVSFASAIAVFFSTIGRWYAYVDIAVALILLLVYLMRAIIRTDIKVLITVIIPIFLSVMTFTEGGFASGAVTLMLISNAIAVLFLPRIYSGIIAGLSVLTLGGLWRWSVITGFEPSISTNTSVWVLQLLLIVLFIAIFQLAVYAIRGYLFENIVELEASVGMTTQLAYYDQLTKLPNQYKIKEMLKIKEKEPNCEGYLIFLSLINLNMINTIHGDEIGDAILKRTALYFESIQSEGDLIGRVGGNEFALWLKVDSDKELRYRLALLRENFQQKIDLPELANKLEYYISYAKYEPGQESIGETYDHATLAMTYAKYKKQASIVPYDELFEKHLREEEDLKARLKVAVEKDHFSVHYQTKVDGVSKRVVGVEALARWDVEAYGKVSPCVFVPMVEALSLAVSFGRLIVSRVMSDYQDICKKYGPEVKVSINISPSFLADEAFDRFLKDTMILNKVPPNQVILEITEQVAINGSAPINAILAPARQRGIQVSLDDFGTGYSSLNYLTTLMVDELKIDKSFVDRLIDDPKTKILLKALIQLAKDYGLSLVAEGVESKEQHDQLIEMGCKVIQGYYYTKPEPL